MQDLTPIPTRWKGWNFRSRLEARWAVFLTVFGVKFLYEPQAYQTEVGWYLPDFWFPGCQMFGEVKPVEPSREALAKCAAVAHGTGYPFAMLVGMPGDEKIDLIYPSGSGKGYSPLVLLTTEHLLNGGKSVPFDGRTAQVRLKMAIDAATTAIFDPWGTSPEL